MPTIVMPRADRQPGHVTPGSRHRSPGRTMSMSRIDAGVDGDTAVVKTVSSMSSSKERGLPGLHGLRWLKMQCILAQNAMYFKANAFKM